VAPSTNSGAGSINESWNAVFAGTPYAGNYSGGNDTKMTWDSSAWKKEVVKEHVVPLKVITDLLISDSEKYEISSSHIKSVLDKYLIFATITKEEDAILRMEKLTSKMPDVFYHKDHYLYDDLFARYKVAGIELKLE
jgi:hypothetical protein